MTGYAEVIMLPSEIQSIIWISLFECDIRLNYWSKMSLASLFDFNQFCFLYAVTRQAGNSE